VSCIISFEFFVVVDADIQKPRILSRWSTIGSNSASLVWRCSSCSVRSFLISYRVCLKLDLSDKEMNLLTDRRLLHQAGFTSFKVKRFLRKRSHVVIRNLSAETDYVVSIVAVNDLSCSSPCVLNFKTLKETRNAGIVNSHLPQRKISYRVFKRVKQSCKLLVGVALLLYLLLTACVLFKYREELRNDVCAVTESVDWQSLTEWTCHLSTSPPVHIAIPLKPDTAVDTDVYTDIEMWLSQMLTYLM